MGSDLEPELEHDSFAGCALGCLIVLVSGLLLLPALYVAIVLARLLWP